MDVGEGLPISGSSFACAMARRNFAMRIFEVAPGGHTPLHNHPYEHEIFVMDGAGTVWRDGQEVAIKPGDVLYIPADEKHQFKNTVADKPFKFMCLIPAKFQKC